MRLWLEQRRAGLSRKSPLAEAIGYALNQWEGLTRFLDDGRIEIDSNTVERSMRPIALNRKNALFAGHDLGAENWAVLASWATGRTAASPSSRLGLEGGPSHRQPRRRVNGSVAAEAEPRPACKRKADAAGAPLTINLLFVQQW
jgi:hypothetical protein